MIYDLINELVSYGLDTGLIDKEDMIYSVNRLFALFNLDGDDRGIPTNHVTQKRETYNLQQILSDMLEWAKAQGFLEENTVEYRDILDTKIMACITPPPSQVIKKFRELYAKSPKEATDWFYDFSQNTDYIRRYRISKDIKWTTKTEYGDIDITINLSKPEKDPKAIAAAKLKPQGGYPKCQLCIENEGYAGRVNHPARSTHRIIPVTILGEEWGFQYSPYVYYNEHCILLNKKHVPMVINRDAFAKLLDFVKQFPHYMVGSNADLPIVGGSILSHEHFQGGNYQFPMARAETETPFTLPDYPDVEAGIIKWPLSVIRIRHSNPDVLVDVADFILTKWRGYTDKDAFIFAETEGTPHNTISPIARYRDGMYEMDLALRNNITTDEHPMGVYHPHQELHHIKKENIGLIEVMGLAILPPRLRTEMDLLAQYIIEKKDIRSNPALEKHADWAEEFISRCTPENVHQVLKDEIGKVFAQVLTHAGVYKRTPEGKEAFLRFIAILKK